jgi:hypothetical protein
MIKIDFERGLTVQSKPIIEINRNLSIRGLVKLDIPYRIVCDLSEVPPEEHSIIIQTLMSPP